MARQTYYATREQKHPLYKTRMLTAGQELELDAGAAALYRKLGVEMTDQISKRAAKVEAPVDEGVAAFNEAVNEKIAARAANTPAKKAAPKKATRRKK